MRYVVDSYAWVEYLEGSPLGEKVRKIIVGKNEIFSLNLTISEVVSRTKRKEHNVETAYNAINSNSKIAEITPEIAKKVGLLHAETKKKVKDFGLIDALILTLARELKAKILTGDKHFKNFKEAVFMKKP